MLQTRIAPTPSGFLHLGNALSFLLTWLIARRQGGRVFLRIDDVDNDRTRPEYVQDIFDSLAWLGLDWDVQASSQLTRTEVYRTYLQKLSLPAQTLYPCTCSRKAIQTHAQNGLYGQTCLPQAGEAFRQGETNMRLHIPDLAVVQFEDVLHGTCLLKPAELSGDLVIWRKTDEPAYHLASVVDDVEMGINFIVRGEDLWSSTAFQCYLAEKLGESSFKHITFLHHPLVLDNNGNKLSKSAGSTSLQAMREQGEANTIVYKKFAEMWQMQVSALPTLQELLENLPARFLI